MSKAQDLARLVVEYVQTQNSLENYSAMPQHSKRVRNRKEVLGEKARYLRAKMNAMALEVLEK